MTKLMSIVADIIAALQNGSVVPPRPVSGDRADELEWIIPQLDYLYYQGEDCLHPDTGVIVSDGEYDAMRRELKTLRPDSEIFATATAATATAAGAKKVKHYPPMTSIEKASHEDVATKEGMLFKWMDDCVTKSGVKPTDWWELRDQDISSFDPQTFKKIDKKTHVTARKFNGKTVRYPAGFFYASRKIDGAGLRLYYEKGVLVRAGLRPRDGVLGEDVTEQAKYVQGIPTNLSIDATVTITGEIICKLSDFEKVQKELAAAGEQLRANPRNHAAGGIRQFKDPSKVAKMRLSFIAHGIDEIHLPDGKMPYHTEIEKAKWCNKVLGIPFVRTEPFNFYLLEVFEANAKYLDYWIDGVVIGVNDLDLQEQLGRHGDRPNGNPRGKIAWKFAEERQRPEIKEIVWQVGRTGVIKPVAVFDPVPLAGTQVRRATLHNVGFIMKGHIGIGTTIEVLKAGAIIPKVVGVVSGQKSWSYPHDAEYPKCCPSCGEKTKVRHTPATGGSEETWELMCENPDCPAKHVSSLCYYLSTIGVLGVGESKVESLVDSGAVHRASDFYKLTMADCLKAGLSERQGLLLLASIHMVPKPDQEEDADLVKKYADLVKKLAKAKTQKKVVPLWQLFASFGIPTAGKSCGKALVSHFNSFDNIRSASVEELEAVPEVGTKTAGIVANFLARNSKEIDELLKFIEPELPKTGKLSGKKFCLSGGFAEGKRHWEEQIESLGGKCSSGVSKTTDYLVAGDGSGAKTEKAKELKVPIIDIDTLKKML